MKRIHVLRHAKSSWDDSSMADHDRPLAPRGKKATDRIAAYIGAKAINPQLVLCSPARRARETLEGIRRALGDRATVEFETGLYLASASQVIERLRTLDEGISSVMVIGHNPGLAELVLDLASGGADLERVRAKFPTAALAVLEFEGTWRDLGSGCSELVDYVVPRDLK